MTTSEKMLHKIDIPSYTMKQETFNSISHLLGIPLGILIVELSFGLLIARNLSINYFIGLLVFGISVIALYLVSGLYHGTDPANAKSKKIRRVLDHCTIYFLIAGTYTPICIYLMSTNVVGLVVLIIEWFLAVVGITINAVDFSNKFVKAISMVLYLALGWLIIFSGGFIYLPFNSFLFILIGGITYTAGSILYGIGHKILSFHSIFHVFVLLGTIFQSVGVLLLFL